MEILVNMKQLGAKRDKIKAVPFVLAGEPKTVRELIVSAVQTCTEAFRQRGAAGEQPLTEEQMRQMEEIGKIAFGVHWGNEEIDPEQAKADALQAYEDGLVRIFIGEEQLGAPDNSIRLHEHDTVTFLRLTFLAGRMW
ncbi:MAG: hypothetical protein IJL32_09920 [Oscillospiraceae bacterium]|nr:hypothetical protein [Oscillospiraceae bacterium]